MEAWRHAVEGLQVGFTAFSVGPLATSNTSSGAHLLDKDFKL